MKLVTRSTLQFIHPYFRKADVDVKEKHRFEVEREKNVIFFFIRFSVENFYEMLRKLKRLFDRLNVS